MERHFPQRKPTRLRNFDYSRDGRYFITLCTRGKINCFGDIDNGIMQLNPCGEMVGQCILKIGEIHPHIVIPCKIVMPDHVHFIIEISDAATVGAAYHAARQQGHAAYPQNGATRPQNHLREKSKMAIPKIIQQFKTATMKLAKHMDGMNNARRLYDVMGGLNDIWLYESRDGLHDMQPLRWQRGYYDHIIRNEEEYGNICRYMETNPQNWRRDEHLGDFAHENENLDL